MHSTVARRSLRLSCDAIFWSMLVRTLLSVVSACASAPAGGTAAAAAAAGGGSECGAGRCPRGACHAITPRCCAQCAAPGPPGVAAGCSPPCMLRGAPPSSQGACAPASSPPPNPPRSNTKAGFRSAAMSPACTGNVAWGVAWSTLLRGVMPCLVFWPLIAAQLLIATMLCMRCQRGCSHSKF